MRLCARAQQRASTRRRQTAHVDERLFAAAAPHSSRHYRFQLLAVACQKAAHVDERFVAAEAPHSSCPLQPKQKKQIKEEEKTTKKTKKL